MKKLGFLFAFAIVAMIACKNEGAEAETASTITPSAPTSAANVNQAVPTANPINKNEPAVPAGPITTISFDETEFDFGMIMDGEKVVHEYKFKNTGDEPLIVSNAKGSCGCTVPDWPREPIAPGEAGVIKVQFDSKNKGKVGGGLQSKRVTITANTDPVNTYLTIKGKVDKKEEAATKSPS
ncbi:MAG: DUF1573 domain-containing protein [Saprospiraceae bacterium]|nr:DUF1573 domain-containing protein [Bacteroidia bacterium]MBT8230662.1 DUF1573 domain-containing protein [Bacteroidia bacterium]NNF21186.1 DUF1573 domain-containing protein [Saprospiraceae bacterium]NNK90332.1 DUF1573 domain-containing protein [Saprospiraceae bacterium]